MNTIFCFIRFVYRLRSFGTAIQLRFVTNTTKESKDTLLQRLHRIGFTSINKDDMFTSLSAAVQFVQANKLKPFYLLTEDAKKDFGEQTTGKNVTATDDENAVVVGLAPDKFIYETMNAAFRYVCHLSYSNK